MQDQTTARQLCRCGHRHDEHDTPKVGERWSGRCKQVVSLSGKPTRCRCESYRERGTR